MSDDDMHDKLHQNIIFVFQCNAFMPFLVRKTSHFCAYDVRFYASKGKYSRPVVNFLVMHLDSIELESMLVCLLHGVKCLVRCVCVCCASLMMRVIIKSRKLYNDDRWQTAAHANCKYTRNIYIFATNLIINLKIKNDLYALIITDMRNSNLFIRKRNYEKYKRTKAATVCVPIADDWQI